MSVVPLPAVTISGCAAPRPRPGTTRPRSVSVHGGERGLAMWLYARLGEEVGIRTAVAPRVVAHLAAPLTSLRVAQQDIGAVGAALSAHRDETVPEPLAAS